MGAERSGAHDAWTAFVDGLRAAGDQLAAGTADLDPVQQADGFRALVRGLEERALLDPRPGRTADEAATEAGRLLPGHASELRAAAQVFDGVRYGGQAATGAGYARITRLDTDVERTKPAIAGNAAGGPR